MPTLFSFLHNNVLTVKCFLGRLLRKSLQKPILGINAINELTAAQYQRKFVWLKLLFHICILVMLYMLICGYNTIIFHIRKNGYNFTIKERLGLV